MSKPFSCDTCGPIDCALFDGYDFGDRLLEGVMFRLSVDEDGQRRVEFAEPSEYTEGLNKEHWYKEALIYAAETDTLTCPQCSGDIDPT